MNKKFSIISYGILLLAIGFLYLQNRNLKWEIIYKESVPDVWLSNSLAFDSKYNASGSVTGFVAFDDQEKQPRGMRQYEQITASSNYRNGRQVFYLTDIIKMDALAPYYSDWIELTTSHVEGNVVSLTDGKNNSYLIDLSTMEVRMFDSTRDVTRLITDDSEFREFMTSFLSN